MSWAKHKLFCRRAKPARSNERTQLGIITKVVYNTNFLHGEKNLLGLASEVYLVSNLKLDKILTV